MVAMHFREHVRNKDGTVRPLYDGTTVGSRPRYSCGAPLERDGTDGLPGSPEPTCNKCWDHWKKRKLEEESYWEAMEWVDVEPVENVEVFIEQRVATPESDRWGNEVTEHVLAKVDRIFLSADEMRDIQQAMHKAQGVINRRQEYKRRPKLRLYTTAKVDEVA